MLFGLVLGLGRALSAFQRFINVLPRGMERPQKNLVKEPTALRRAKAAPSKSPGAERDYLEGA